MCTDDDYIIQRLSGEKTASVNDRLFNLLFFVAICSESGPSQVLVTTRYLAYTRKDRQTKARDPITLKYVAQLLQVLGVAEIVAVEVHKPAVFQLDQVLQITPLFSP